jgi:methylglyoxal synthase
LWWCGVGHRYDFDRFIIFLGNGDIDHIIFIIDPFFSLPHTQ